MDEGKREIIVLFSVSPRGTGESSLGIVNVFFFPMAWCTLYFKRCVCDDYEQDVLKSGWVFLWCISTSTSTHCQPYKQCSPVSLLS